MSTRGYMINFRKAFGLNLKKIRKSKNITQEELSELVDIHPRQISKIETGDHFPSCKTLERLCCVLDIHPSELFDFQYSSGPENSSANSPNNKEVHDIFERIKTVSDNKQYLDFIKLALDVFNDDAAVEKMELFLSGIKLGKKQK